MRTSLIAALFALLALAPSSPRFEPVQPELLSAGGTLVNAWADYDGDGDLDLALTGAQKDGTHALLRNLLAAADARRSLEIRVLDSHGRATLAGAEVRVYAAGTRRLLGARLVDSGSGYDAQSDQPVHVGLPKLEPVDVEVVVPRAGRRVVTTTKAVDPREYAGRALVVRIER